MDVMTQALRSALGVLDQSKSLPEIVVALREAAPTATVEELAAALEDERAIHGPLSLDALSRYARLRGGPK